MANASLKSTETRDELSTTCNLKVMSRCLSAPDATSLHQEQAAKSNMVSVVRIQVIVLFTVEEGVANTGI